MKKTSPGKHPQSSPAANDASDIRLRRTVIVVIAVLLACMLATVVVTTLLVDRNLRRITEADLQARATSIARTIDLELEVYKTAMNTIAQSHALREEFDLLNVEQQARRVGALLGGGFILARSGDFMEILMPTFGEQGSLPLPQPRTNYPEVMRAEAQSVETGEPVVSDAFQGSIVNELFITIVAPIESLYGPSLFIYFSVSLRDITMWLEENLLDDDDFVAIANGAGRVIARSPDNEDFLFAGFPEWYSAFREGRDSGTTVGPPFEGGVSRLFALQRLQFAPGWTLAISSPLPMPLSAAYLSPWPAISGIIALLLGGVIAGLYLSRIRLARKIALSEAQLTESRAADSREARLMAVLAHDLRTPLVAMLGALDLFRDGSDQSAKERILHRLKTDGHGMLALIDDVLELARLGVGVVRLRPEPFAPIALLTQIADLIQPSAERHGTEVVVQADDSPMLRGDVASLRRVLLNFAINAVKATRGGSVRISATLGKADAGDHTVTFAVTDTGCGIAPEDIPRLFCDFGMLERDSPTADGTGLGLAICRSLATAMGGEVGVESTLGAGSRFWLRVILPEAEDVLSEAEGKTDEPFTALVGLNVLVVEDHDIIRRLSCAKLARAGMLATGAADGAIAVELAEAEEFDLILMDLQLPRLNGDEAASRIRGGGGLSARARIICVTAHQSPEKAAMLSDLAFDACVQKPLDLNELAAFMQGTRCLREP